MPIGAGDASKREHESRQFRRRLFRSVLLLPALMAALAAVLLFQIDRLISVMSWVDRSSGIAAEAHRVRELLVNMEFGVRGYLASGDAEFLEHYRTAGQQFDDSLAGLGRMVSEEAPPEQHQALERLRSQKEAWRERAEKLLTFDHTKDLPQMVPLLNENRIALDLMKDAIGSILESDHAARAQRIRERREAARIAVGAALLLAVVLALVLAGFTRAQLLALSRRHGQALADVEHHAEALRKSEELFRAMIEHAWDGFSLIDASGQILYASSSTQRILGYEVHDLTGRSAFDLIHPDDRSKTNAAFGRLLGAPEAPSAGRFRLRRKDGSWCWVEVTAMNLLGNPRVLAVVVNFRDVTDRKLAEDERNDLLRREKEARSAAESANRAKDEFLATLSHELRSPLSSVLTALHILRSPRLDGDKSKRALEVIERSVRVQTRLMEDLLDVSRIVSGKLTLETAPVDLAALVSEATEAARSGAESKGLRLYAPAQTAGIMVGADSTRLLQALGNLLSNSIKFTPAGGEIRLEIVFSDSSLEITIRDTGIGIRPEVLSRIFDRFEQADSSLTRRHGGLGLGLAIARHIITLHGGTIEAESAGESQGATFRIRLPLQAVAPAESNVAVYRLEEAELVGPEALRGTRVLVVDDDEDARDLLSALLADHGAEVTAASSVIQALEAAERFDPHVILTDLAMPGEDGFALIRKLGGETSGRKRRRVIALTALASTEDRRRALEAGFDLHLTKPVEHAELIAAVCQIARDAREGVTSPASPAGNGADVAETSRADETVEGVPTGRQSLPS